MAPNASDDNQALITEADADEARARRRRTAARYVVPAAVVGVAAATIGLVPAIADSGDPDLPEITAQQLLDKVAASDVEQLSGTVKITTDLGLPDLGGLADGFLSDAAGGSDASAADPTAKMTELVSGTHTVRVATDGPEKQKISLLENAAEYSLIHNGKDVWGYDSGSNEVYHSTLSERARKESQAPATPKDLTEEALKAVDPTTSVTVDGTVHVAGRDAYKLLVKPKQSGTTVGAISIAVDAKTGLPLKFTLTPRSGGAAVVDAGFTQVTFAKPAASTFDFTPPKGAKVTQGETVRGEEAPGHEAPGADEIGKDLTGLNVLGKGWTSIATYDTGTEGMPATGAPEAGAFGGFLDSFGDKVSGDFGKGTVFSTRLVNALVTDDGKVYVGAVTKDALVKAAEAK
ncbi:outer membrane lipoprotein carrier protein LolA [Streptomyces roseirectus]|uniref:Outer membrane lipoprotein carrier protein LolA n=1 Tax=Streptomyces roseirectus TaxID=2768066 RepID=A0A7H0IDK5_9ACTN|nr:outer membrane lipoprotein carrier protein LolA [Streptomyces roseirectus]QNP70871.1 outer membrane lipoprotein carrier protein LolA [Streptomyces roseirectus]